jgi:hypothetical protein
MMWIIMQDLCPATRILDSPNIHIASACTLKQTKTRRYDWNIRSKICMHRIGDNGKCLGYDYSPG